MAGSNNSLSNRLKKMKMKKVFLFALATAMMSFAGCQQMEQEAPANPNEGGSTFEFVADIAQTKTTLDVANGYKVDWEESDVVYMVTDDGTWGKPYSEDKDAVTIAEFKYADGKFTSEATIADGEYTFKGMYAAASQKSYQRVPHQHISWRRLRLRIVQIQLRTSKQTTLSQVHLPLLFL